MASAKELLRYEMLLDRRDAIKGFDQVADAGKDAAGEITDEFSDMEGGFKKIGGKLGKGLVAGFAALGVGALLADSIGSAFEREDIANRIQGQFRFTEDEAARSGEIAGELYANGWGQGFEEVQATVGLAMSRLGITSDEELSRISEGVLATTKTFGVEFDAVIRSISQLLENDLAGSADEALDHIVAAFQGGANEAGDALETVDEYAQHWSNLGFTVEDAMGLMTASIDAGQRDTDKAADAVKELFIRITDESEGTVRALEEIGLEADVVREAFLRGGEDGRQAYIDVIAALTEHEEATGSTVESVALVGTQYEDLGRDALRILGAIGEAVSDVDGRHQELAGTVEGTDWEKAQRRGENYLASIGKGALIGVAGIGDATKWTGEQLDGLFSVLNSNSHAADEWAATVDNAISTAEDFGRSLGDEVSSFEEAREAALIHAAALDMGAESTVFANKAATEWANTTGNHAHDLEAAADAQAELTREQQRSKQKDYARDLQKTNAAFDDVTGATEDAAEATEDFSDEVEEARDAFANLRDEMAERSAYLDIEDAFDEIEDSALRAAEATAEFGADSREAAAANRDHERDVMRLKDEVIRYRDEVGNIPDHVISKIIADIDEGRLAEAEAALDHLERTRNVPVVVKVSGGGIVDDEFILPDGTRLRHSGGRVDAGSIVQPLAGEAFVPDRPGRVLSRAQTRDAFGEHGGGGVSYVTNLYVQAPTGEAALQTMADMLEELADRRRGEE